MRASIRTLELMQRIRLIKKLAPLLNGIDLSKCDVGDILQVPEATAAMLIREGWAELVADAPSGKGIAES